MQSDWLPRLLSMALLLLLAAPPHGSVARAAPGAPAYYPSGPQANVNASQLAGWQVCWSSTYGTTQALASILNACDGDYLLLAGRPVGSSVFDVLAARSTSQ